MAAPAKGSGRAGNAKACSSRRHRFTAIRRISAAPQADATIASKAAGHTAYLTAANNIATPCLVLLESAEPELGYPT